jgi:hypothetical protein
LVVMQIIRKTQRISLAANRFVPEKMGEYFK